MMNEPEITLFGTKIAFSDESESLNVSREEEAVDGELTMKVQISHEENQESGEVSKTKPQEGQIPGDAGESQNTTSAKPEESHNTIDEKVVAMAEGDATNPQQQKALMKPDTILPCPRCNSMDTKFCYYNNYNVKQPRHFCRDCQRYWTAGGTMRNVPVGAGRRKNQNCHQLTISQALHTANIDARNEFQHGAFKTNGAVLSFGPNSKSMASVLNPSRQKVSNWVRNGCLYRRKLENKDDVSLGSLATTSNLVDNGEKYGLQHPTFQNMNVVSCPYPWNPAVPLPFFPPVCGMPNAWTNSPWISPTSSSNSPLGKRSRSGELIKTKKNSESSIVVPKALRINDPEEAAKSSIWSTLGIKYDSRSRGGLFKSLQPKVDLEKATVTALASPALTANPAALSRSVSFRERA